MYNADLPNSHAEVTPDWRPYKFERSTLQQALKLTRIGSSAVPRYAGTVPPAWCASTGRTLSAHGGFCASVLVATAIQYSQDTYADKAHKTPLSISLEFLTPLPMGPYEVAIHDYGVRGSVTTIRAEITTSQQNANATCCIGLIRLRRDGAGQGGKVIQPKTPSLPDRVRDCARWTAGIFYYFNPPTSYVRMFTPDGEGFPLWSEKFGGQSQRWQWFKLDYEEKFGILHLPVISDLIPGLPLNYEEDGLFAATRYQIATLSLHLEFRTTTVDEEWLVSRTTMNKLQNGLFDMGIQIMNDQGDIVATSTQTWSFTPRKTKEQNGPADTKL